MKKFLAIFALAGVVGMSACSAEENNTDLVETPEATTPPPPIDPAPVVVDEAPPLDSISAAPVDSVAP